MSDKDGTLFGHFYADLYVEGKLADELKTFEIIAGEHAAQILGYLRASRIEDGVLINSGVPKLKIRKYVLDATRNEEDSTFSI